MYFKSNRPAAAAPGSVAPWYKGEPGLENSLFFWAYARNKRSVSLDLDRADGIARLKSWWPVRIS